MKRNKNRTEDSHRSLERRVSALNDSMQLVANQVSTFSLCVCVCVCVCVYVYVCVCVSTAHIKH